MHLCWSCILKCARGLATVIVHVQLWVTQVVHSATETPVVCEVQLNPPFCGLLHKTSVTCQIWTSDNIIFMDFAEMSVFPCLLQNYAASFGMFCLLLDPYLCVMLLSGETKKNFVHKNQIALISQLVLTCWGNFSFFPSKYFLALWMNRQFFHVRLSCNQCQVKW